MAFLPATPRSATPEVAEPPAIPANPYVSSVPRFLAQPPAPVPSRADELIRKAEQRYQRGRRAYQAKDAESARREFDSAIDLMLEASEAGPTDRAAYDKKLDGMVDAIHRYELAGLGSSVPMDQPGFEKAPLEDILEMTFPVDPNTKHKVLAQLQATASQLPLSLNDTVLSYINYFSGPGRKTLVSGLQRAGRYRPLIERIFAEEGLPPELIHLAQAESGFLPRAVSRKAAVGMWQFVKWRGNEYGLRQTAYADDRLDPEKATRSAARHLHDLYNHFGDWYLAIAAYNCGPGVVERAVERTGYADFWELRRRRVLPAETTNYVPIILAMTIMDKNAAEYGLEHVVPEDPIEYDTLEMKAATHLALVADLTDTPLSELVALNPALLKNIAPPSYLLRVPKGAGESLVAALQLVPAERRASWRMHKVGSGETLAAIGRRYNTSPSSILAVNSLSGVEPAEGERLLIPAVQRAVASSARRPVRGAGIRRVAVKHNTARRTAPRAATREPGKAARKGPAVLTRTASTRVRAAGASN